MSKPHQHIDHAHEHNHDHAHAHGHHHHHHHKMGRIQFAFIINICFALLELVGGIYTNSVAVMSDAIHDFGDAIALGFAWYLERVSIRKGDAVYSYGFRRLSTLSALFTGVILIIGAGFILAESIPRLLKPEQPKLNGMFALALVGVAVNGWAAWRVSKGSSLNEKMITWHLIEDVLGWVLVLISSVVMWFWNIPILDSVLGLILAAWVIWNVFRNLKETAKVFLQAVPSHIVLEDVERVIIEIAKPTDLHHTHLWSMDGEHHIFTAHMVLPSGTQSHQIHELKAKVKLALKERFQIFEICP